MSRLLARINRERREREVAQAVARALLEAGPEEMRDKAVPSAAGPAALRGVPVIGRGCGSGAILGTAPGKDRRLDRWEGRSA